MRIVYLHQYFRTPTMVSGIRSYEFARRLVDRGHEVHVLTSDPEPSGRSGRATWRTSTEAGVTVHWAAVPYRQSMSYQSRVRAFGHFARLAAPRAAAIGQDLVVATSTPLTIAIPAVYSAWRRQVPLVLEIRDLWPEVPIALGALRSPFSRRAAWALESWAYRHATRVIALSPGTADSIGSRFPTVPVSVVPNGCDRMIFADADRSGRTLRDRTPWLGDRPLILYAGTLGLVNDVGYLVRMAAVLRQSHPDVRVAIVGNGSQASQVRRLAVELGVLDNNLFMVDEVSRPEIVGYFGACDLAISTVVDDPALRANSANKIFDGWAAGRPVAVNHEGWLADVIRNSGAGLVLPAGDPAAAATAAGTLIHDPGRARVARAAAVRLATEEFDRDLLFRRFEETLLDATTGRRPVRAPV